MRPVDKGTIPQKNGKDVIYSRYQEARGELIARLGELCSYCEMHLDAGLDVEHVQPKSLHPSAACSWDNFLLACKNCNSTKGNTNINAGNINDYLWPDKDNTFLAFKYTEGGEIQVNSDSSIPDDIKQKAQRLLCLVGLDKGPNNNAKASDRRWQNRLDEWGKATKAKEILLRSTDKVSVRNLIEDMVDSYFSIWLTVFADDPDMCWRLIRKFKGTATNCFERDGKPIHREGGQI